MIVVKESETYARDQSGNAATPATADSKNPNDEFSGGGDKGDDVGDEHPLGNILVDIHGLLRILRERLSGLTHIPDLEGVKPELSFRLGAKGGFVVVVVVDIPRAVTPETDGVEILQIGTVLGLLDGTGQLLVGDVLAGLVEQIGYFRGCLG